MTGIEATVFVVDDDPSVLRAISRLLRCAGFDVTALDSAEDFLAAYAPGARGCLLLDIGMPGLSGLDLQVALGARDVDLPVVFLSGRADVPTAVRAMKQGAFDLLVKPVGEEELLRVIRAAVERDRANRASRSELAVIRGRLATLTPREREVLEQVVAGRLNKQAAAELGTAEKTIKVHRARVMQKMGVTSVAELVLLSERGGVVCPVHVS